MKLISILFITAISLSNYAQNITPRVLVSSGGGARGAWGVGVATALIKEYGGYTAVFGVSTGSLMAPLILVKDTAALFKAYTEVTQKDIFNKNPFKIKENHGVVTAELRWGYAIRRLIGGKATLGESYPLKELVKTFFNESQYDIIKEHYFLGIGVTNMKTGKFELKTSDATPSYSDICNWIWASANEPLWMSYYENNGAKYVDGGITQIVPLIDGIQYAIDHNINNVDVIINNSVEPIDRNWNEGKSWIKGLLRALEVYSGSTTEKDLQLGNLMMRLNHCQTSGTPVLGTIPTHSGSDFIEITYYFMDSTLASTYQYELAFFKNKMEELYKNGYRVLETSSSPDIVTSRGNAETPLNPNILKVRINKNAFYEMRQSH